ncbi:MAG TPA: DegT/DnrJ/EryC1/StrS family aminotransferase [Phycisphaerae bacterium]|nr:DegT/DnrJ/EryC1/StrS family aminotransferase [Phycisphaerae bacterium]
MAKKKQDSDFRYATGATRIPWDAVGEHINPRDVGAIVEFLLPPPQKSVTEYNHRLRKVKSAITKLGQASGRAGKLSLGDQIKGLEKEAARFLDCKYACFLTNATAGFEIGFKFANLRPGDEVIAPAITFLATIAYPLSIGAKVVIADVDPATVNMDPKDVARKITKKTKAIIPVHVGGYPVDMAPIMRLARKGGITVIEDAAHAFGGYYRNKALGTIGHFGSFSFHEVKNITSLGEGGILVSNLREGKEFSRCRFLGLDFTRQIPNWLYDVPAIQALDGSYFPAGNHSSTEIQALGLRRQLKRVKQVITKRRQAAEYLNRRFAKDPAIIIPPPDTKSTRSTHHLYLLRIDHEKLGADVQLLKKKLSARGVTQIPHFGPLYKFSIMRQLGYDTKAIEASCPNTEMVFNHQFTHLPLYDFSKADLKYLADAVLESVHEMRQGTTA